MFHVFGALAEFERSIIRERTKAGLEAARARGRKGGRKPALSARDAALVRRLMADPKTVPGDVAKRFEISKSTLYKYVRAEQAGFDDRTKTSDN